MEFRVLGPIEIWAAGAALRMGEPRQRLVLAALLVEVGRTVGVSTLVDRVWGESPPAQARRTLHAHLSRIRRVLGQAAALEGVPAPALIRSSGGYCLAVEPDQVDLVRFHQLQTQARDPGQRRVSLQSALDLWHGEALAGLPGGWAERLRRSLEQERIGTLIGWAEEELRNGDPSRTLRPLTELAAENPLLEPASAVLIRALHTTGHSADALDQFAVMRRRLRDELGTDPGPELRAAQQEVLQADQQPGPGRAGPGVRLAQLPSDVRIFIGRDPEMAQLQALLPAAEPSGVVIVAISGMAGVGKTALALRWAHRVRERFPDGQLFIDLRGYDPERALTAAEALGALLGALIRSGSVPHGLPERAARFRSELAGRRMLIFLDNAASVDQVRPLLPGSSDSLVLVTSRDSLAGLVARDGATRLDLDLLPLDDATALLDRLIGPRAELDPQATIALAERCARLPLALRVAAELAISRPAAKLAELVDELADHQRRLDLLDAGGDERAAVRTVFSWSVRQLEAGPARLFRLLGLLPSREVDGYTAAALTGGPLDQARAQLEVLARAHLIHPLGATRFGMHDLLRAYAADLSRRAASAGAGEGEHDGPAALHRVFDYYLATAAAAMDRLHPGEAGRRPRVGPAATSMPSLADPDAARRWLEAERSSLLALAGSGIEHWPEHTVRLSATLFRYFDGGDHADALAIHTAALQAARHRGRLDEEALALNFLGAVSIQAGDYPSADEYLSDSLTRFERLADPSGQARALGNQGTLQERLADYPQAARYYERALPLFVELGDTAGEAHILTRLGAVAQRLDRLEPAAEHLERALARHRQAGHRFGEAWALSALGAVEARLGRDEQAAELLARAQTLFRELGDRAGEAWTLTTRGDADLRFGRRRRAADLYRQARSRFQEIGERDGELSALNGLAEAALAEGHLEQAQAQHAEVIALAGPAGARDQQARAHAGLARAHHRAGDRQQAEQHGRLALSLFTALGLPDGEALQQELSSRE